MNYLDKYAPKRSTPKFQMGGEMAPEPGMEPGMEPAPAGGGDVEGMLMQYAETRDPQLAVQICDTIIEMMAQQQGGAPAGGEPMMRNGGRMSAPKFRKGGRLVG